MPANWQAFFDLIRRGGSLLACAHMRADFGKEGHKRGRIVPIVELILERRHKSNHLIISKRIFLGNINKGG